LRAHSVSLLKYNSSHPRTDVHVDNGILAMTLAMTPMDQYEGGGTFFEHFDRVLPMDAGHGTFRPGSVRHGGHRVTSGTRYVLGAFLLLEDRVEHVRRLKNRGSSLRKRGDLDRAMQHFSWALSINPKCTTCLKDWAEILHSQGNYKEAEEKVRLALELLEEKDSDAFFSLGQILSGQGRNEECIQAYYKSLELNKEDAELLYNLGVKLDSLGEGQKEESNTMYARAIKVDPNFGGAWLNWGTNVAEYDNDLVQAEALFLKALQCDGASSTLRAKAMMNLAIVKQHYVRDCIQTQAISQAKQHATECAAYLDEAKPLLEQAVREGSDGSIIDTEAVQYLQRFKPLRLGAHKYLAQFHAGEGNLEASEEESRKATDTFPDDLSAWNLLGRVLEVQGKQDEAKIVMEKMVALRQQQ